jgi:ParB family chromosome partitioning protein
MDDIVVVAPAVDVDRIAAEIACEIERHEVGVRESQRRHAVRVGRLLLEARPAWPARGPRAKGWGEFLERVGVPQPTASAWMKLAESVPEFSLESSENSPTYRGAGLERRPLRSEVEPDPPRLIAPHVSHNTGNNEWYTPPVYLEAARLVLGAIDLDPASSAIANESVKATKFYSEADDGLARSWRGRVWMNPPYAHPLISQFCDQLVEYYEGRDVTAAIVLVNNGTETKWGQRLLGASSALCLPAGRIRFVDPDGNPGGAPLQGQMVVYLGDSPRRFAEVFGAFGPCLGGLL